MNKDDQSGQREGRESVEAHVQTRANALGMPNAPKASDRLTKSARSYQRPERKAPRQEDPLIQNLDHHDNPITWLNETLKSRSQGTPSSSSALSLKLDGQINEGSRQEVAQNASNNSNRQLMLIESHLTSFSTSLNLARQDTLESIDETMADISTTLPRLGLELRLMSDAAKVLQEKIFSLRTQTESVRSGDVPLDKSRHHDDASVPSTSKDDTQALLQRLAALSALHSRMLAAKGVLSLAESWSTLSMDISAYLSDAKFDVAASRLEEARSSLSVFERTPEYDERHKLLEDLTATVIKRLTPSLEKSIRGKELATVKTFAESLRKIQRTEQFAHCWHQTRGEAIVAEWGAQRSMEEQGDSDAISVHRLLKTMLEHLIRLVEEECTFAPELFPAIPRASIDTLAASVLDSLEPSITSRLDSMVPFHQHSAVLQIADIHSLFLFFANKESLLVSRVEQGQDPFSLSPEVLKGSLSKESKDFPTAMEEKSPGVPVTPRKTSNPTLSSHGRRLSTRRLSATLSSRGSASLAPISSEYLAQSPSPLEGSQTESHWSLLLSSIPEATKFEKALFDPLLAFQLQYETLERAHLRNALVNARVTFQPDSDAETMLIGGSFVQGLRDYIDRASILAKDSARRAKALTYGLGSDGLLACVDEMIESLLSDFKQAFDGKATHAINFAQQRARERQDVTQAKQSEMYFDATASSSGQDEQWKAFEEGISLVASLRYVWEQIEESETFIATQLKDIGEFLFSSPSGTNDTLHRLCKTENGVSTASFKLLLGAHAEKLRSGPLLNALKKIRMLSERRLSRHRAPNLLRGARSTLMHLLQALQRHLTDLILSPQVPHLEVYPSLAIWDTARLPGANNEFDLAMPSFSLSPTEDMSRIGEALLELPRLLEVWGNSQDMQWGTQGLAYTSQAGATILNSAEDDDSLLSNFESSTNIAWGSETTDMPSPVREKRMSLHGSGFPTSPNLERRSSMGHRNTASIAAIATLPARGDNSTVNGNDSTHKSNQNAESTLQSYLSSTCLTLVSHLISLVLPSIPRLSNAGASQLAADLEYLLTILTALNVTHENVNVHDNVSGSNWSMLLRSLEAWKDVCKLGESSGRRLAHLVRTGQAARGARLGSENQGSPVIEGFDGDEDKLRSLLGTQAFDMLARMRGW